MKCEVIKGFSTKELDETIKSVEEQKKEKPYLVMSTRTVMLVSKAFARPYQYDPCADNDPMKYNGCQILMNDELPIGQIDVV